MQNVVFLIIISNCHLCSKRYFSAVCRKKTIDDFQQSCFTGSVIANNSHFFSAFYRKVQVRKQRKIAERLGQMFYFQNIFTALHTRMKLKMETKMPSQVIIFSGFTERLVTPSSARATIFFSG